MISQLDRDLAELQQAAGAYAARHQLIPDFGYPPGVRIAVNFTLDFDSMLLRRLMNEPPNSPFASCIGGSFRRRRSSIESKSSVKFTAIRTPGG